ncbi:uncharacterized protein LOC122655361 [Telopea speciosissima]|uniref:uncharacterized protein LOC122655361 n=1 Tax=Telopea speciosissima TaxID=54955 RepID=UPI001CC364EC|nr:uncharacterized protein LOC122655361 [Telopea speciosissima]
MGSPNSDGITFVIKTLNPNHTCQRLSIKKEGVTAAWIAKKLASNVRADPYMNINVMEDYLSEKYGVKASKNKLYKAKCIVNEETDGSHARAYKKLENYGLMVKERNPGTEFGCRPFIGLDGCHLKGVYGGVLISAIAIDGNNGMFPLAYGVVETECKDSWLFFLHHLLGCIGIVTPVWEPLTFMTDKQKGLIEAIGIKFPIAHHRHCSRHLYNNFKTQFGGGPALRGYFWRASKSYNAMDFQRAMNAMKEEKPEAYEWLMKTFVCMWARLAFNHRAKSDHITNNMIESFNQWVGPLRGKPILTLVDQIRLKLMGRFQKRYAKGCTYEHVLTPRMQKTLDVLQKDVRYCHAVYAGVDEFEVQDGLNKRYLMANGEMIHPLSDVKNLADTALLTPVLKRSIGRPSKNRKREADEPPKQDNKRKSSSIRCDRCKEYGHNRRTCKGGPIKGKGKGPSSSRSSGVKRKRMDEEPTPSQRVTRSSQNSTTTSNVAEQDKAWAERVRVAAKGSWLLSRMESCYQGWRVAVKEGVAVKDVEAAKDEVAVL